eukprot:gene5331-6000_t
MTRNITLVTGTSVLNTTSDKLLHTTASAQVEEYNVTEIALMTTFLVILIIATLFGNGLVLGIFYSYKPLRTVTNFFIVSLAFADILVATLCMPIWIAYTHVGLVETKFGNPLYRLWICLDITSGVSSVMNLSFVSVDRYIHILLPLHYHSVITAKRAKFILFGIWLYAASLAAVKGFAFFWPRPNYEILIFVLGFLVPFSVMGLCYYKIFGAARRHVAQMKLTNGLQGPESIRQLKAAKTIAVVILAFFVCWGPFFVLNLCFGLFPNWQVPDPLIPVAKWLHYTNSALNPIIYACFNREYRSAFRALLTRKKLQSELWAGVNSNNRRRDEHRKSLMGNHKAQSRQIADHASHTRSINDDAIESQL